MFRHVCRWTVKRPIPYLIPLTAPARSHHPDPLRAHRQPGSAAARRSQRRCERGLYPRGGTIQPRRLDGSRKTTCPRRQRVRTRRALASRESRPRPGRRRSAQSRTTCRSRRWKRHPTPSSCSSAPEEGRSLESKGDACPLGPRSQERRGRVDELVVLFPSPLQPKQTQCRALSP